MLVLGLDDGVGALGAAVGLALGAGGSIIPMIRTCPLKPLLVSVSAPKHQTLYPL